MKWIKKIFKYAIPLVPYAFLMMLYEGIDKIMVETMFGLDSLGSYTFAYQVSGISSVFLFAVFNAISPSIYRELSERQVDHKRIMKHSQGMIFLMFGFSCLYIAIVGPLIEEFIDASYHVVTEMLPILLVSYLGRTFFMILSIFLLYYHRNNSLNIITSIAIASGLLFALLLKDSLGIIVIYFAVFLIKNVQALLTYFYVKKFGDFELKKLELTSFYVGALIISGICLIIPYFEFRYGFLIPIVLTGLFFAIKWKSIRTIFLI